MTKKEWSGSQIAAIYGTIEESYLSAKKIMPDLVLVDNNLNFEFTGADLEKIDEDLTHNGELLPLKIRTLFSLANSVVYKETARGSQPIEFLDKIQKLCPNLSKLEIHKVKELDINQWSSLKELKLVDCGVAKFRKAQNLEQLSISESWDKLMADKTTQNGWQNIFLEIEKLPNLRDLELKRHTTTPPEMRVDGCDLDVTSKILVTPEMIKILANISIQTVDIGGFDMKVNGREINRDEVGAKVLKEITKLRSQASSSVSVNNFSSLDTLSQACSVILDAKHRGSR